MSEEWTDWIEHNGSPTRSDVAVGTWVHLVGKHRITGEIVEQEGFVEENRWRDVVRFRIRKPRALQQLRDIAALKREPVDA